MNDKRRIECILGRTQDADSEEHIVLNALGGTRTVSGLLALKLNNELGKAIDAPFEEDLRPFSVQLGAKRGDGKPVAPIRRLTSSTGMKIDVHSASAMAIPRPFKYRFQNGWILVVIRKP